MKRIFFILMVATTFAPSSGRCQPNSGWIYTGALEYSLPLLTTVPPLYAGQPMDVELAYLWLDGIMRSTPYTRIDSFINTIQYGDALKNLADITYQIVDDNCLSEAQWESSAWPQWHGPPLSWIYKGNPGMARPLIQNQIGGHMGDTGRTGFLVACDIIADVAISDTFVKNNPSAGVAQHMVMANSSILDEIKGKYIPASLSLKTRRKGAMPQTVTYAIPVPATAVLADTGSSLPFEYSPEWATGPAGSGNIGDIPYANPLADSTGWWVKPDSEYIVFLRLAGTRSDTAGLYFSVQPFWGVFGHSGGMYKVIGGYVVDPYDDFSLGGTNFTVAEWKSRLRARIRKILGQGYIDEELFGSNKQLIRSNFECFSNFFDIKSRHIANPSFDTAYVCGMQPRFFCKLFLAPITELTIMTNIRPDNL